ncbi:MAG: hypothetical protein ACI9F9_002841, partial [Candidatus Paceibacteria bacterium]
KEYPQTGISAVVPHAFDRMPPQPCEVLGAKT